MAGFFSSKVLFCTCVVILPVVTILTIVAGLDMKLFHKLTVRNYDVYKLWDYSGRSLMQYAELVKTSRKVKTIYLCRKIAGYKKINKFVSDIYASGLLLYPIDVVYKDYNCIIRSNSFALTDNKKLTIRHHRKKYKRGKFTLYLEKLADSDSAELYVYFYERMQSMSVYTIAEQK